MEKKTSIGSPSLLSAPTLPAPAVSSLRPAPAPPQTCCYAHDAVSNKHDAGCLVGMIYRVSPDALDALYSGFTTAIQKRAEGLAEAILAVHSPGSRVSPGVIHAAIEAFNKVREKAVEAQNIIHERESAR